MTSPVKADTQHDGADSALETHKYWSDKARMALDPAAQHRYHRAAIASAHQSSHKDAPLHAVASEFAKIIGFIDRRISWFQIGGKLNKIDFKLLAEARKRHMLQEVRMLSLEEWYEALRAFPILISKLMTVPFDELSARQPAGEERADLSITAIVEHHAAQRIEAQNDRIIFHIMQCTGEYQKDFQREFPFYLLYRALYSAATARLEHSNPISAFATFVNLFSVPEFEEAIPKYLYVGTMRRVSDVYDEVSRLFFAYPIVCTTATYKFLNRLSLMVELPTGISVTIEREPIAAAIIEYKQLNDRQEKREKSLVRDFVNVVSFLSPKARKRKANVLDEESLSADILSLICNLKQLEETEIAELQRRLENRPYNSFLDIQLRFLMLGIYLLAEDQIDLGKVESVFSSLLGDESFVGEAQSYSPYLEAISVCFSSTLERDTSKGLIHYFCEALTEFLKEKELEGAPYHRVLNQIYQLSMNTAFSELCISGVRPPKDPLEDAGFAAFIHTLENEIWSNLGLPGSQLGGVARDEAALRRSRTPDGKSTGAGGGLSQSGVVPKSEPRVRGGGVLSDNPSALYGRGGSGGDADTDTSKRLDFA